MAGLPRALTPLTYRKPKRSSKNLCESVFVPFHAGRGGTGCQLAEAPCKNYSVRGQRLEPEDLDELGDGVKFRIASDDNRLRSQGSADGEGIGVGDGKLRLHLGGCKDVRRK